MSYEPQRQENYAHNKAGKGRIGLGCTLFFEGKCVTHWGWPHLTPSYTRVAPSPAPWGTQRTHDSAAAAKAKMAAPKGHELLKEAEKIHP